jgi:mannose-6-phosphate isomerase-like protein (cupin superfamily)
VRGGQGDEHGGKANSRFSVRTLRCQPEPVGDRGRLAAVSSAELAQDVRDVDPGGARADVEGVPDLAVGRPAREVLEDHETAIYILRGRAEMRYGDGLREHEVRAGQFLFIPAGMPHLPFNPSDDEACVAILARTDPNEQESVVLLDDNGRLARRME